MELSRGGRAEFTREELSMEEFLMRGFSIYVGDGFPDTV